MANEENNELKSNNNKHDEFDVVPNYEETEEEEYSGTCYWCGLCSETNGVCVRNNQSLLSKTEKRY